ncbi:hypothetical protein [Paraburkholderia diazotrophica]|uniref:hypothetical protein n=1 Tax=Paraburkholderia diazotrophica TaxID=667676 RepID=UPI00317F0AB2
MQLAASRSELVDGLDGDYLMPHCCKRSRVGSYTRANVEYIGRARWDQMQNSRVVFGKRDVPPLTDQRLSGLRVALRTAHVDRH